MSASQTKSLHTRNMMASNNNISSLSLNVLKTKRKESKVVAPRNPKLLKTTEVPKIRMRPSTYLREMSLDTEQKLASTHEMRLPKIIELLDMSETTHQKVTYVDIEEAMFQPFPSEIVFQNFKPFVTIEVPLLLRNNDKVPRLVKVMQKDSPYFDIISPDDVSHKVAPGMASTFRICFTPEENKDYDHELICMTEREKFLVPVKAIGARAILDFPDEINFGVSPVKHPNSKVILVRNIGNNTAKYTVHVKEPFSIHMEQTSLAVGDSMQITIDFKPDKVGDYEQDLVVKYDCGDEIHVNLYGGAIDANVRLDKNILRLDNTFISMANQRVVTIHNRSDVLAHFKFSPFATMQEELLRKQKFCTDLDSEEAQEKERFFDECALDPTLRDRLSILTRTFHNRKQVVEKDSLLFRDDVFQIKPVEGEIWPNSFVDVAVVFRPTVAKLYQQTVFCDITGRETRLPLKIRGEGMGPKCALSFDSLDIGDVFAGSSHCYEIILENKGDIDAIYGLVESKSHVSDDTFSFNPAEGIVLPNGHQAIKINFSSKKLGPIKRNFVFTVDGAPQPLIFKITGKVIGPTFHFDVPKLKMGNVSFGFNHTKICILKNTSLVGMNVNFRIPDDGNGEPSISSTYDMDGNSMLKDMSSFKFVPYPREFDISPAQGYIRAQSEMKLHITICSNTIKKYNYLLHVDVQGIGKSILTLPISAFSVVPEIKVLTPILKMGRCFIDHPYLESVELANESDLPAKYYLIDQEEESPSAVRYSSPQPRGIISPHSSVLVPVEIKVIRVQDCEDAISFGIFGSSDYPTRTRIRAKGEGAVVHYYPERLDYGMVEVLTETVKTIHVENESFIPAEFTVTLVRKDTVYEVEPSQGTILPNSSLELQITALLNDTLTFQDKVIITIEKGQTISIPVESKGFGTSIFSDPPLAPSMDLGSHFAEAKFVRRFKLTNRGRRQQQLTWSTEGHNPMQHRNSVKRASNLNPNDMKYKDMMKDMKMPTAPTFQIVPPRLVLKPGESTCITLEGESDIPREVTETLSCCSVLGTQNSKEKIIKTVIHATFITPVVDLDCDHINFRVDKPSDDDTPLTIQKSSFKIQNISSLPLTCTMATEYPFQLMDKHDKTLHFRINMVLDINEVVEVVVCFDPMFKYDLFSRCVEGTVQITYQEHPHCEVVRLHGEVNFPNLDLDKDEVDFECILNDTEVARYVDITNCSPLPLSYRWSFVVLQGEQNIVYNGEPKKAAPVTFPLDENLDIENIPEVDEERMLEELEANNEEVEEEVEKHDVEKPEMTYDVVDDVIIEEEEAKSRHASVAVDNEDVFNEFNPDEAIPLDSNKIQVDHNKLLFNEEEYEQEKAAAEATGEDYNEKLRSESRMSSKYQPSHPANIKIDGYPLLPWLEPGDNRVPNGVEEIFDILPLYGTLEPGETQRVTFTYYGHAHVSCTAKAVCEVQGGPKYQVELKGSASLIEYNFDRAEVDFGKQMYDQVAVTSLKLENTGKVGFDFEGLNGLGGPIDQGLTAGVPVIEPMCGHVDPYDEVMINVYYFSGVPEKFHKTFQLQVAHFEPTVINIKGEGVFNRLSLDLPRIVPANNVRMMTLLQEARNIVLEREKERQKAATEQLRVSIGDKKPPPLPSAGAVDTSTASLNGENLKPDDISENKAAAGNRFAMEVDEFEQAQDITTELEVQMEFERLMLRDFAINNQNQQHMQLQQQTSLSTSLIGERRSRKAPKLRLSEYLLDFGHIVLGNIKSHIVRATNTSYFPFSFKPDRSGLFQSGFCMDLDRVKALPGFPDHETVDFKITFDPRGGNLAVGPVSANVPINIIGGPQINIRLRGIVAVPDLKLNTEAIDFETVQCGQCKIVTLQFHNTERVPCEWISTTAIAELKRKKETPFSHQNAKKSKKKRPKHFEMMPDRGMLLPDARANVQIKFMPTEEKSYSQKLVIHIAQATSRISISCRGRGLEPRLELDPSVLSFGPILPHGSGVENTVIVRNPCPFPIEFYSLNFDSQYLTEEKILRHMQGYDEFFNLLLPPRNAGDALPPELLEFHRTLEEDMKSSSNLGVVTTRSTVAGGQLQDSGEPSRANIMESPSAMSNAHDNEQADVDNKDEITIQNDPAADQRDVEDQQDKLQQNTVADENADEKLEAGGVGELEITPVSKAIARHLGIDLTPEGRAARNRRGIVVVIHGPPRSGKTNTAVAVAKKYGAARLTIDSIVLDAISDGNSKAGLKARELCQIAARGMRIEEENESALQVGLSLEAVNAHSNPPAASVIEEKNKLVAQSVISTKRTSVLSKQTHSNIPSNKTHNMSLEAGSSQVALHDTSPPGAPIPRRLSVSASVAGEEGLVSSILPEELLVEILAERFQLNDCHQGFVIDGIDTLFSSGHQATIHALLKAINNRRFIYFIALKLAFQKLYDREKKKKEEEEAAAAENDEDAIYKRIDFDELDEDEYEALPEHIKERLEREKLQQKRQRIQREAEEKLELLERQRLLEQEKELEKMQKGKGKKGAGGRRETEVSAAKKVSPGKSLDGDRASGRGTGRESRMVMKTANVDQDKETAKTDQSADAADHLNENNEANSHKKLPAGQHKKGSKGGGKHKASSEYPGNEYSSEERNYDDLELTDELKAMLKKFVAFDYSFKEIVHVLDQWDRSILDLKRPSTPDDPSLADDDPKPLKRNSKKEREKEKLERERMERERQEKEKADREKQEKMRAENENGTGENPSVEEEVVIGVPCVIVESNEMLENPLDKIKQLPTSEEVLDGLGLGVNGPPIPPPVSFSVVPFPVKRKPPSANERGGKFEFILPPPPTIEVADHEDEIPENIKMQCLESPQPSNTTKKGKKEKSTRKNSPSSSRKHRRNSQEDVKSPPVASNYDVADNAAAAEAEQKEKLTSQYRWTIPAGEEIPLKIHFKSDGLGQFDQTLDFELTSTRRKYQLFCRGISGFPTISRDPRVVFSKRRKAKLQQDEIVFKRFLMHENYYEFGPLLCGKTRERYKEKRYTENVETISIKNVSPLEAVVSFCFQYDINATTFILDPPNMVLEPDEVKTLNVWAYPKTAGRFTDSIVCCVRENPEPITYDVACHGVRPEIELDKKLIQFDKILLHRKDTRTLFLHNITLLPVAWRVAGVENLGEDFTLNQESGIIATQGEFALQLNFRATKPVTVKKIIRIEVYDVDNIMGLVQAENVQVIAEAYDVALDMSFPKGSDGGLDFGTIRVLDESKQICSLKNKGKYEIGFNFVFEPNPPGDGINIESLFSVLPQKGTLVANDRPTQVQVMFRSDTETTVRDLPLLKCQVIEPNLGEGKEVIASIPIKLSAKSLFSKYEVYPTSDINFGPMLLNARKSRNFTIVNKGEFDFKFSIGKMAKEALRNSKFPGARLTDKAREGSSSSRSILQGRGKNTTTRQDTLGQARLQLGVFTIYPGIGTILPGGSQVVTVDCFAENIGKSEEYLSIDVSDRDPKEDINGVMYKLACEGCLPGIDTCEMSPVFEEHRIVPNMTVVSNEMFKTSGVYCEDDNKFHFTNIIVGKKATARFKISNTNKVPVDITSILKSPSKAKMPSDIFEVEPARVQILPHDSVYITVTFAPTAMQQYSCVFETTVDGLPPSMTRGRIVTFEITGEGSIPRVVVVQPKIINKKRNPLLAFKRTLLGKYDQLQLALKNEGIFECHVNLILEEEEEPQPYDVSEVQKKKMTAFKDNKVFGLTPSTGCKPSHPNLQPHASGDSPYTASVLVEANTTSYLDVHFHPNDVGIYNGTIRVLIVDNQFEEHRIQLYAESFQDDVTIENLHSVNEISTFASKSTVIDMDVVRKELTTSASDGVGGCRGELLDFGDCYVNKPTSQTFTMTNNSKSSIYRFAWERTDKVSFKPTLGHLHPGCSKEVTATYTNEKPEVMVRHVMKCELNKITFPNPNEVIDWDDRLQIIRWIDVSKEEKKNNGNGGPAKKKVMETEVEPVYQLVEQQQQCPNTSIELFVSARANYATFTCDTSTINFRNTLIMQPRVYEFTMVNTGDVVVDYSWQFNSENSKSANMNNAEASRSPSPISPRYPVGLNSPVALLNGGDPAYSSDKPFTIAPMHGGIPVGESQTFSVRFAPMEVNDFQSLLICEIQNLNPSAAIQEPTIAVKGRSIMPHCHFDFEDSDYLTRHNVIKQCEYMGSLECRTRCFELSSIGLVKNQKKFWIMNPTSQDYHFRWTCLDDDHHDNNDKIRPPFTVDNPNSELVSGKKLLMTFTYSPHELGTIESQWRFEIIEKDICVPFLLVGHCREPQLSLNLAHLNFKPVLVGRQASETIYLVNKEQVGFYYTVKPSSCHADALSAVMSISPMEGYVDPNTQCPITLTYKPKLSGKAGFNIQLSIARKFKLLTMNVKAVSYAMDVKLVCENSIGNRVELSSVGLNAINLGDVQIMERCMRTMHIINVGSFACKFAWKLIHGKTTTPQTRLEPSYNEGGGSEEDDKCNDDVLSVVPGHGFLAAGESKQVTMTYQPRKVSKLRQSQLVMEILEGPAFACQINGKGVYPGLEFSFDKHNFGPCFVYKAGMPINQVILKMVNRGNSEISVECLYKDSEHLHVRTAPLVLQPDEGTNVPIRFYPRDLIRYCEKVTFRLNGLSTKTVEIRGEGTEMKVEVLSSKQKVVKFGAARVGRKIKHVVPIINRSPRPISFNLSVTPINSDLLEDDVIRVLPRGQIELAGNGGKRDVEVYFNPKRRISSFTEEVMMECAGLSQPLFIVTGCCQGIEIVLDQDSIPFGAIVMNSRTKRRFTMKNVGDIGASFKWEAAKFKPDFTLTPTKGYISPGMEIPFEIEFRPTQLSQDIRYEGIKCHIENHNEPLKLTLTGMCINAPQTKEVLSFSCVVRAKDSRNIMMTNRSNGKWSLQPVVEGEFFYGPDTFVVEPGQNKSYEIDYRPLLMTSEGKKHMGSVFFPLPDGTGLLYNLVGNADPPKSSGSINRDVPCKTAYVELLSIDNWLNKPQRFKVTVEMIKPDRLDSGTTLKGMDYIDVPPVARRDYKLKFFAHKEGTFGAKVIFKNEKSGEYLYYYVTLRATSAGVISVIELQTSVRRGVSHTINIENPLSNGVVFYSDCKMPEINLPPQIVIPAQSEGSYTFEYLPLKSGEYSGKLMLLSQELGHYTYDLQLKASSCGQERVTYFTSQLGQSSTATIKFVNYARQKTEYTCKFSVPIFGAEVRGVTAAPASSSGGTEVTIDVWFEPMQLGKSTGTLTLTSPLGGEYNFPLVGECVQPKPQGPYTVKRGGCVPVPFKNVFAATTQFLYRVDNNYFVVKPQETIRSKKVQNITVAFDGKMPCGTVQTGKLTVTPCKSGLAEPPVWVFYLKGYSSDGSIG